MLIIFVDFIDQSIDYPNKCTSLTAFVPKDVAITMNVLLLETEWSIEKADLFLFPCEARVLDNC